MPIVEDRTEERIVRDCRRRDYDAGDYLIRDRANRDRANRDARSRPEANALPIVAAGSTLKSVGGIAVAVLAILALVGVIPRILMAIAGIVFGVAMFFEGAGITSEYRKLGRWIADTSSERVELAGATGIEVAVGVAAVVLGILSLIGVSAGTLIPVLVITGGAGLIIAVGTVHRLSDLQMMTTGASEFGRRLRHESIGGAAVVQTLGGLAALALGILALIWNGTTPAGYGTLAEIGMICLGVAAAVGGGVIAGRSTMLYRSR